MKVIGIAGWSGAGKTTLLTRVIPLLTARGLRVSTIKHAHHAFDIDQPGKDSHTHRMAGATEVLISSANRFALMHELRGAPELTLARAARPAFAGRPRAGGRVQARDASETRSLSRHRRQAGAASGRSATSWRSRATDRCTASVPVVSLDDIDAVADILVAKARPLDAVLEAVS